MTKPLNHTEFSRKGGKSRSEKKIKAGRENIRKATEARLKKLQEAKGE